MKIQSVIDIWKLFSHSDYDTQNVGGYKSKLLKVCKIKIFLFILLRNVCLKIGNIQFDADSIQCVFYTKNYYS